MEILWNILKYFENCLKSDRNLSKIQKPVRNIARNTAIKDNTTLFLKTVNKAVPAYAKQAKNSYYAWWFTSSFVKLLRALLRVTNFERQK